MEWESSFSDYGGPSVMPQQHQLPQQPQQPLQPQQPQQYRQDTQQQLMPNVYQPNISNLLSEDELEHFEEEGYQEFDYKTYITLFILIVVIYFILSLDTVKNQIGKIITCINLQEDGTVSKCGFFCYGAFMSLIVVALFVIIDRYVSFKF